MSGDLPDKRTVPVRSAANGITSSSNHMSDRGGGRLGHAAHSRHRDILDTRTVDPTSEVAERGSDTRVADETDFEWKAARVSRVREMKTRLHVGRFN